MQVQIYLVFSVISKQSLLTTLKLMSKMRAPVGSLAQSVEQRTFNPLVERSNRSRPTSITLSSYSVMHCIHKSPAIISLDFILSSTLQNFN